MWKKFLSVALPYWKSEDRFKGFALLAACIGLSLVAVYITYTLTNWNQQFYDSIQKSDIDAFYRAIKKFGIIAACLVSVAVYRYYLTQLLTLRWRKWFTDYALKRWMEGGNYYFWQHLPANERGDNPDQRITEDITDFVSTTINVGLELFSHLITLGTFSVMLWNLSGNYTVRGLVIPGFMLWMSLLYALIGSVIAHWVGKKIAPLNYAQQTREANFRFGLIRIRENAESILLMKGSDLEYRNLKGSFKKVLSNFYQLINQQKKLVIFTSTYNTAANVFPIVIAAPKYFAKEISLGQIFQISSAFGRVNAALSYFVDSYTVLARWSAVIQRLHEFFETNEKSNDLRLATASRYQTNPLEAGVILDQLKIKFPDHAHEIQAINTHLKPGESLMIQGPSGVGKSTLLRVLAQIWPHFEGKVTHQASEKLMMIPQKPYLPIGTLREALSYPHDPQNFSLESIQELLKLCGLEKYQDKLDQTEHWSQILSPGEQQRLALIRAFLQKPEWLFIDEGTSALDEETQSRLYQEIKKRLIKTTLISVAHRSELTQYHDRSLNLSY